MYTGAVPASVDFVTSSDNGQVTAAEVMAGTNNQVKVMLEESLLVLANIVVEEEFGSGNEPMLRKTRRVMERRLVVENATEAIVDDVQDVGKLKISPNLDYFDSKHCFPHAHQFLSDY